MAKLGSVVFRDGNSHTKTVGDVRWNCNGDFLASASFDKTTKIGQLDNSGNLRPFQTIQRSGNITQALWHPTETNLISLLGEEKAVEIWDIRANRTVCKINSLANNINASWSPNGNYIAIGNKNDHLTVLDARAARQLKKLKFNYEINELSWSFNSNYILIATGGSEMGGVDVVSFDGTDLNQISPTIPAHTSNCYCLKVDPTYTRMAVGSADFLVSLWDLTDLTCHHTVQTFDSPIRCLAYSSDGERLAAAAEGNILYICNSYNGEIETTVDCRGALMALSWHPRYDLIAIAPDINSGDDEGGRHRGQLGDKFVRLLSFSNIS